MRPRIPGARGWRVLADGIFLVVVGAFLPARQFNLLPVEVWEALMVAVGLGVVAAAYWPKYALRAALSILVPLALGIRAVAVLTVGDPTLIIASGVWALFALHIVAALSPGEELKP